MKLRFIKAAFFASTVLLGSPAHACLAGFYGEDIQAALNTTGTAELCQGAAFEVLNPILVPANGRIFTSGYPEAVEQKALLFVSPYATFNEPVVNGHMQPNVEIRNIRMDGNGDYIGYVYSRALIAVNGNNSIIHRSDFINAKANQNVASADNPNCNGLTITYNFVGYSGGHSGGSGFTWTDGIGLRCSNAHVAHNTIRDLTDGGITFYGGQNTIIEHNWVTNSGRSAYSGIIAANLFAGDFTGSIVRNNLIETCCGQHIHVAIAVGTNLWCNPAVNNGDCQMSSGATFVDNSGTGSFGWGLVVDGMLNATVQNNNLYMYEAAVSPCFVAGQNYYVVNTQRASGSFQPGYVIRNTQNCLGGH